MRDHHDDAAAGARAQDRLRQRLLALGVEVGVRLVEHERGTDRGRARAQARRAAAAQPRARSRPRRSGCRSRPARRRIRSCTLAAFAACDDRLGVGLGLEAGDILSDGAGEQLHVLRQIADMLAERFRIPLLEGGAVEAYLAAHRRPDADEQPGERRLARGARPDDAEPVAGLEREGDVLHDEALDARRRRAHALDREGGARPRQRHRRFPRRERRQAARSDASSSGVRRRSRANWRSRARPARARARSGSSSR